MTTTSAAPPPQAVLSQMINGYWVTGTVHAAARLGIADRIGATARPVADLAREVEANPDALFRLMRALASLGIFAEGPPRSFRHTPLSEALRREVPGSMHGLALMTGLLHLHAWPEVVRSVRTGQPAFDHVFGKGIFEHVKADAEAGAAFDEAMAGYTASTSRAVVAGYDFSPFQTIVDVGGGNGALLAAILEKSTAATGVNFDLPTSTARAEALIAARGIGDRCTAVAGDFFVSVPAGGDAYVLKSILHDWDDERCVAILKNVRSAMKPGARLLAIETVIDPASDGGSAGKLFDINMLVMTHGRERTAEEFAAVYRAAGFEPRRVTPLAAGMSVIEGEPA